MERFNSIKKVCGFYVSSVHLVTMLLPYLNKQIEEQIEVIPFLEFDLRKNVETILSKIVLNEKNKEQILDINWKNTKVQKFTNIESTIKEKLKNEKEAIILVSGSKKYIKIVNEMIERYFNNSSLSSGSRIQLLSESTVPQPLATASYLNYDKLKI